MSKTVLEVKDLVVHYETDEAVVEAVNNISFSLEAGDTLDSITIIEDSLEPQEDETYAATNSTKYYIRDAEWITSEDRYLSIGDEPKMRLYLYVADDDYAFRGNLLSAHQIGNLAAVIASGFIPYLIGRKRSTFILCLGIVIGRVMMTVTDPEKAHEAISVATDFCIEYGRQQVAAGAHILFPADPSASGDLISPETYQEFVLPYHQRFARSISAPKILHMCGHTEKLLPYIRKSGMDCFSFDAPPAWYVRKELGNEMTCLGSLDVIDLMPNGTPEQVYARTVQCIREGVDVVGTACDVSNGTPLANLKAYVQACRETPKPDCCDVDDCVRALGRARAKNLKAMADYQAEGGAF